MTAKLKIGLSLFTFQPIFMSTLFRMEGGVKCTSYILIKLEKLKQHVIPLILTY